MQERYQQSFGGCISCLPSFVYVFFAGDMYERALIQQSQDTYDFQTQPTREMSVKGTTKIGLASYLREPILPKGKDGYE